MHIFMMRLARIMAMIGGAVLTLLIFLTCISIVGRLLNGVFHGDTMEALAPQFSAWMAARVGPVNGDFELVEAILQLTNAAIDGSGQLQENLECGRSPPTAHRLELLAGQTEALGLGDRAH